MASGFFVKFHGGPLDGRLRWVRDGQTKIEVYEMPTHSISEKNLPPPRLLRQRSGWYESTGPQTENGYIFTWRGWS